jgi:uracil-DNA glycosylase
MTDVQNYENWQSLNDALIPCKKCARLVTWREEVAQKKRKAYQNEPYWGRPVPGFGDTNARVLVVGLAPGAHGSNRTGRMFTGDASGEFLYPALYQAGFANQAQAVSVQDELQLQDLFISAVCRCAPPDNKPLPVEIQNCLPYLLAEIHLLPYLQGIVCLGKLAFDQTLRLLLPNAAERTAYEFKHLALFSTGMLPYWILSSYHPSRQNTQTGRLTVEMFAAVWQKARSLLVEKS